ncbi:hypothetical protein [Paraburkholderia tropica]|uniref:hypothetical protein n=1 Tax=Paraburkholderia tropica TaxID=92647 RepID=UPI002AB70E88|nr:hypothetical protein [Paraburkholderia tropica]
MEKEKDVILGNLAFQDDISVLAVNHNEIVSTLSRMLQEQGIVLLHMLYPRTDARTHQSLDALSQVLRGQGEHEVASLIEGESHYLLFHDPLKAWRVFRDIRLASLAIGVHIHYCGLGGDEAEQALQYRVQSEARVDAGDRIPAPRLQR